MKLLLLFLLFFLPLQDKISVENAWMRNASKGMNSALYFSLKNNSDKADVLYQVESSAAELVQIHETYEDGEMTGMREVKEIVIEPNSVFNFKPRSHHIMLIRLKKDLKEGSEEEITLHFKNAGPIKFKAQVRKVN